MALEIRNDARGHQLQVMSEVCRLYFKATALFERSFQVRFRLIHIDYFTYENISTL